MTSISQIGQIAKASATRLAKPKTMGIIAGVGAGLGFIGITNRGDGNILKETAKSAVWGAVLGAALGPAIKGAFGNSKIVYNAQTMIPSAVAWGGLNGLLTAGSGVGNMVRDTF